MPKGSPIYNPDVQSDIDMKNTYKLVNYPTGSTAILSIGKTIYVDSINGTSGGQRGTSAAFQTFAQAVAVLQSGDEIVARPGNYTLTGSLGISVPNVTISGNGAIIIAASQTDVVQFYVTADSVTIEGFQINGLWTNAADVDNGAIWIDSSNCCVKDVYVHHSAGYGIRLAQDYSGTKIQNCRIEYCNQGVAGAMYGGDVDGVDVSHNRIINNRNGGVRLSNNSGTGKKIYRASITDNFIQGNHSLGIELFLPHINPIVSRNYVAGSNFGISMAVSSGAIVSDNIVFAGSFCGIEWAGQIAGANNVCEGNWIDGTAGGVGYSISSLTGNVSSGLVINGGEVVNCSANAVSVVHVDNISIKNLYVQGTATPFSFQYCNEITVEECRTKIANANAQAIYTEALNGTTTNGFYYRNNTFLHTIDTTNPLFFFYLASGTATMNNVQIEGTRTDSISIAAGYVLVTGALTLNAIYKNNLPDAPNSQGSYGFINDLLQIQGAGSFSTSSRGVLLKQSSTGYKIGFDDVGATKGYIRYNVDTADANHGHVFSAGTPGSQTDIFSIFGNSTAKVGSNTVETQNNKGAASGYAPLDGSSKVPAANLPTLSAGTIASTTSVLKGDGAGNAVASTPTGTGDNVLATSPTLITPAIGVANATSLNKWTLISPSTSATLTAGADNLTYSMPEITTLIGFRHIPQNSKSANYTTVLSDSGKNIYHPVGDANARTFTIDSNANVAYPIGTGLMFTNMSANNLTVAITSDTMTLLGTGTTGSRTVGQYGRLYVEKDTAISWLAVPIANIT